MGQSQSQSQSNTSTAPPPPQRVVEELTPEERKLREERAAEDRATRLAAIEKRLGAQTPKQSNSKSNSKTNGKKKLTALEEASRENKGWRDADEIRDMRSYN